MSTQTTFAESPTIGSFKGFTASGFGRPELPFIKRVDDGTTNQVKTITKNDQHISAFMSFDFGRELGETGGPPARSLIVDAYLRLFTIVGFTDATVMSDIDVSLVAKDGKWDVDASLTNTFNSRMADVKTGNGHQFKSIVGRNTSGGALFSLTPSGIEAGWDINKSSDGGAVASAVFMGQVIEHGTAGTLGEVDIRMRRVGAAVVGADIKLLVCPIVDGIITTDVTLATSDPIAFSSIGTTFHPETFVFSGADQLVIADGDDLGWTVQSNTPIDADDYLEVALVNDKASIGLQHAQRGGLLTAFAHTSYAIDGAMPLLYESDNETIRVAPHGSISRIASFPQFPTGGVFVEIRPPNFHTLIQQWVNDAGYVTDGNIGVQLTPSNTTEIPRRRLWNDMELIVKHRPRMIDVR